MSLLLALKNQASGGKFILSCVGNATKGWSIMANFAPPVSCLLCHASCTRVRRKQRVGSAMPEVSLRLWWWTEFKQGMITGVS